MAKSATPDLNTERAASVLSDPFETNSMESFFIHCHKGILSKSWEYTGSIEFQKNQTQGTQKFKSEDLSSLLIKMKAFLSTLDQDK